MPIREDESSSVNHLDLSLSRMLQRLQATEPDLAELGSLVQQLALLPHLSPDLIGSLFPLIEKINPVLPDTFLKIGIQGGKASFNELALQTFAADSNLSRFEIEYLFSSSAVLAALNSGEIDLAVFAIANNVAGLVAETQIAAEKYDFETLTVIKLLIRHSLMKRKDQAISELQSIMAHPHVFRQCKEMLSRKYPHLEQKSGTGELIDTARAAQALVENEIEVTTAILGNELIADYYDLEIIEKNLQDSDTNQTYFALASRPETS